MNFEDTKHSVQSTDHTSLHSIVPLYPIHRIKHCPGGSVVRIHLTMQEMQEMRVWSLGWEDPLEKELATHYSIVAWEIPWTEETGGL